MKRRGFSLAELLVVAAIFSIFLGAVYSFLNSGLAVWERTASSQDVSFQLQKAKTALHRDLSQAKFSESTLSDSRSPSLEATTGDVLWCLSAYNPQAQKAVRRSNGAPFWQRNVLYYAAVPKQHDTLFGAACEGHVKTCPHKVLVRKVIDSAQPTNPRSSLTKEETLLQAQEIPALLTAPEGFSFSSLEPGVESAEVVAKGLLSIRLVASPSGGTRKEYSIELLGFELEKAGQKIRFNTEEILQSSFTHSVNFSVFPGN